MKVLKLSETIIQGFALVSRPPPWSGARKILVRVIFRDWQRPRTVDSESRVVYSESEKIKCEKSGHLGNHYRSVGYCGSAS